MSDIGHAYLSGVLLAMTKTLLLSAERCDTHDQWLASRYRAELERIDQVIATSGWSQDDIQAIVNEPVPA